MSPHPNAEVVLEARAEIVRRGRVGISFTILYTVFALFVMAEHNNVNGLWKAWGVLLFFCSIAPMLIIMRWENYPPDAAKQAKDIILRHHCGVLIAMSSGALVVYTPSRRLSVACMVLYLLPGIAGSFFHGTRTGIYFGLVLLLQLFFVIAQGKWLHESYWQSLENAAKAERASRAKSDFLANVSHEMRTPMHGILGMTKLALETNLNSTQREYVEASQKSASSLLSLINGLLDLSKIEAGHMDIEFPLSRFAKTPNRLSWVVSSRPRRKDSSCVSKSPPMSHPISPATPRV
ncbi:MAG: hypothetical protein HY820_21900 [Acidobacteria bacterium]|nr:hypothetical protein [Acidobacteriota bacterium]